MVTVSPDPCLIVILCDPEVAFSIIQTLDMVLGPRVMVQAESSVPVYFKYKDLPGSVAPSATVVVCVSAFVVMASVPKLNASAISSKLVLVDVPQVPDSSPVVSLLILNRLRTLPLCYLFPRWRLILTNL